MDINSSVIKFKVVCNKKKYDVELAPESTVRQLKEHISTIINILPSMQKVMIKGLAKNEDTLQSLGVTNGSKVMVIGCSLNDVVSVNAPTTFSSDQQTEEPKVARTSFASQESHKKIISKGIPDDVTPGIKNVEDELPPHPISGMLNKYGDKIRLTFKFELDQVWLGTKERTQKVGMNSISSVLSEPIEGHEEYHIMALQLGSTEASRYWLYWVPAQYVNAIKKTILGKW